jgi:hypothetical protein
MASTRVVAAQGQHLVARQLTARPFLDETAGMSVSLSTDSRFK